MNDEEHESEPMTYGTDLIEEHVRRELRPFDPDTPEWDEQVESLVDDIVEEFGSNNPQNRVRLAEQIRAIAQHEARE